MILIKGNCDEDGMKVNHTDWDRMGLKINVEVGKIDDVSRDAD
jgi:hypothetical protein